MSRSDELSFKSLNARQLVPTREHADLAAVYAEVEAATSRRPLHLGTALLTCS